MSLSKTLKGLHWDKVPNDNDDEVAARGILYLLLFQQLGQLVRWSWGYHVLLAPKEKYHEHIDEVATRIEDGQAHYTDNPDQTDPDEPLIRTRTSEEPYYRSEEPPALIEEGASQSGEETPVTNRTHPDSKKSSQSSDGEYYGNGARVDGLSRNTFLPHESSEGQIMSFPNVESPGLSEENRSEPDVPAGWRGYFSRLGTSISRFWEEKRKALFNRLPTGLQKALSATCGFTRRFALGLWAFMNPPLWAMLVSIIVASVPALQTTFFAKGTFMRNSFTRAMDQNGQVAVPLILVVLGANLARNTLPKEALEDMDDPKEERKLLIASLIARMLLPTIVMAPVLALVAKYVPVSIMGDPIFVIVCFLLTGAPSALQLAQICQINNVYVGAMSKLLFHSYVIW